jgi:hypothetical protein
VNELNLGVWVHDKRCFCCGLVCCLAACGRVGESLYSGPGLAAGRCRSARVWRACGPFPSRGAHWISPGQSRLRIADSGHRALRPSGAVRCRAIRVIGGRPSAGITRRPSGAIKRRVSSRSRLAARLIQDSIADSLADTRVALPDAMVRSLLLRSRKLLRPIEDVAACRSSRASEATRTCCRSPRSDPCFCVSGTNFKSCHGTHDQLFGGAARKLTQGIDIGAKGIRPAVSREAWR